MAHLPIKGNNCDKLFWNPSKNIEAMVQTNPVGCMHIHQTAIVKSRLDKNKTVNQSEILNVTLFFEL